MPSLLKFATHLRANLAPCQSRAVNRHCRTAVAVLKFQIIMLTARRLLDEIKSLSITHVVGLPDNSTAALFTLLALEKEIQLITVTREGEAFAVAAGLWMGGAKPLVVIQNTGLLESGDALRGTLTRMRLPVVCLISYRGFKSLPESRSQDLSAEELSRRDVDSVALLLEPTLKAWGLPFELPTENAMLEKLRAAFSLAEDEMRPRAVVLTDALR